MLENQIAEWEANPLALLKLLAQYMDDILKWIEGHLSAEAKPHAKAFVMRATPAPGATLAASAAPLDELAVIKFSTSALGDIDPAYQYWPVNNPKAVTSPKRRDSRTAVISRTPASTGCSHTATSTA